MNSTGSFNTANGNSALGSNAAGNYNTASGYYALGLNTTGSYNTANGYAALYSNVTGHNNIASGVNALYTNTIGNGNAAYGTSALYSNTTGSNNLANGYQALYSNTTGDGNMANGYNALVFNTTGAYNTAIGYSALYSNTTGNYNAGIGYYTMQSNTTGSGNIAFGYGAGSLWTTTNNNIAIGNTGQATDTGAIRIGATGMQLATFIAGINGVTVSGGVGVYINANGQLGTLTSSRRFKNDIKAMDTVSDRLMQLRPVTFRYKDSAEKGPHSLQYGLIAEEVAKVYPNLVQYDKQGKPFTVYYHLLTPMLLNELQKEHHRTEALKTAYSAQKVEISAIKATHKADVAEMTTLKSELASLKQTQQQQLKVLARLAAYVQTSQSKATVQKAVFAQH
jgi:hypothetical protein